ncbi:hypothetical protein DRQ36_10995 [bacterium]|nr:MAG: hypothetical protein DRQ36_10995 [bacterium]
MPKSRIIAIGLCLYALNTLAQPAEGDTFWTFKGGAGFSGGPALGYDGTIYAICGDGYLYAINPDGTEKWHREIINPSGTGSYPDPNSPSVGPDGTIYVPGMHNLFAFNPDGTEKWHFSRPVEFVGSASIGPDSSIYISTHGPDKRLYCIDKNGSELWNSRHYSLKVPIFKDRFLYAGVHAVDTVYKIGLDGTEILSFNSICGVSHGAVGSSGEFYYCCFAGSTRVFDSTGVELWSFDARAHWAICPSIGSDGTIYIRQGGVDIDTLRAINPDGTESWGCEIPFHIRNTATVGSDGVIYVAGDEGSIFGRLAAVNPEGSIRWMMNLPGHIPHYNNPVIGEGILYMVYGTRVYAIRCSSSGLARSPWPKYGADNQNSGYVNH